MIYFGVDPGISGALAVISDNTVEFYDCPTAKTGPRGRNETDLVALNQLVHEVLQPVPAHGIVEHVTANATRKSVTASFNFGGNWWAWRAMLTSYDVPHDIVKPQEWQRIIGIPKKSDKDRHLLLAHQLFPGAGIGKNHNRADALLMAEVARRQHAGTRAD